MSFEGRGLHTGEDCRVRLAPAAAADGLVVVRGTQRRRVLLSTTSASPGSTSVQTSPPVHVFEHLAAALVALGVTGAEIEVLGPELPALDGASRAFLDGVEAVGLVESGHVQAWQVDQEVEVEGFGGRAWWRPAPELQVSVLVDFGERLQGAASWHQGEPPSWAGARTFCFAEDAAALQRQGRGLGANPANTWVIDGPVPRGESEPVLHKLLDAIGDTAILGMPVVGHLQVERGSHRLHRLAHQALLSVIAASARPT